jgi:hypothetical protein
VALLRRAADLISERQMEYAALMALEVGKNRLEALGDVEETADLIRYYCDMLDEHDGFDVPMGNLGDDRPHPLGAQAARRLRRHQPVQLPVRAVRRARPAAALVAGNTVVFKPSSDAPLLGMKLYEVLRDAGLPAGVFNYVTGPGETVGAELRNEGIDGIVFTGSFEVGFELYKSFAQLPQAGHRRDGRQEPDHRQPQGRPRGSGRGRDARGLRLRRPEVLGQQPRSTSSGRSTTSSSGCWSRRPGRSPSVTRSSAPLARPGDQPEGGPCATRRRPMRRATTAGSRSAASG